MRFHFAVAVGCVLVAPCSSHATASHLAMYDDQKTYTEELLGFLAVVATDR